jgi:hypothetical protein
LIAVASSPGWVVRPVEFLYSLYDAVVSIDVPNDKARAVVDAMERDMGTHLATKADIDALRIATTTDSEAMRRDMDAIQSRITIRLGSLMFVMTGLILTALQLR